MRSIIFLLVLAACGDDIIITQPDAQRLPLCRELGCDPTTTNRECGVEPGNCYCDLDGRGGEEPVECEPEVTSGIPPHPSEAR